MAELPFAELRESRGPAGVEEPAELHLVQVEPRAGRPVDQPHETCVGIVDLEGELQALGEYGHVADRSAGPGQPEASLEEWPRTIGDVLVEPGTGTVRVRRPRERPLVVTPADARWLAEQPCAPDDVRQVLEAAAAEAERQAQVLLELMEAKA